MNQPTQALTNLEIIDRNSIKSPSLSRSHSSLLHSRGYRRSSRYSTATDSIANEAINEDREEHFQILGSGGSESEDDEARDGDVETSFDDGERQRKKIPSRNKRVDQNFRSTRDDIISDMSENRERVYKSRKERRRHKRYQFSGEERSSRRNESMTTYDYDSDDYQDMASKKGNRRNAPFSAPSKESTIFESTDEEEDMDKSIVSMTVGKMTNARSKKFCDGKENILRQKHTKACKYLRGGNYDKSLQLFEEILSGLVSKYDKRHHRVGTAMHNIGIVHLRAGDLDLALDAINVAVKIREDALGFKHPKVADSLVELGIIYLSRREFQDSLSVFNEALGLREERVERNKNDKKLNLQVAKVLNNIGCVYFEYGELHNALNTFEEALEIQQKHLGADDPRVEPGVLSMASTMCNIAYVHVDDENFTQAIYKLEQALQIQEAVLEADNKLVLNTLDNLAYTYFKDGSYNEALKNYEDILDTQSQAYGPNHIDCAATIKKIAFIYMKECHFEKALEKLLRAMEIEKQHLGPNDRGIRKTSRMINEMNYQLLKFPRIWEAFTTTLKKKGFFKNPVTCQSFEFACLGTSDSTIDTRGMEIKPPRNSSKMAGHKVAYA